MQPDIFLSLVDKDDEVKLAMNWMVDFFDK